MLQDSDTSDPKGSSYKVPKTNLAQVVEKDPDTEILYKWSYRILIEVVDKDRETEILVGPPIQDLCIRILLDHLYQDPVVALVQSGPKGSSYRDLAHGLTEPR